MASEANTRTIYYADEEVFGSGRAYEGKNRTLSTQGFAVPTCHRLLSLCGGKKQDINTVIIEQSWSFKGACLKTTASEEVF